MPKKVIAQTATTERTLFCNFCGESQYNVAQLVAGPDGNICDVCVDLAAEILAEKDVKLLPRIDGILRGRRKQSIDFEAMGVKPRFNKLRFQVKTSHIFYLCPFSEPFDSVYTDHVRPIVGSSGFTIERADEIYGTQPIIEDIWESINSAELIIADVTNRNPNVMYEIGMAHTVGKPVVIITQSLDDVPFDLKHHRCIVYSFTPKGCLALQEKISGTLTFLRRGDEAAPP
jgi:hypothetical protein